MVQFHFAENAISYGLIRLPVVLSFWLPMSTMKLYCSGKDYMSDRYTSFVSGYITPGESAEETAVREVKEEIGVKLNTLEYAGTYWFAKKELLMHGFIGRAKKCNLVLSQEVDSAEWTPAKEVVKTLFPDVPGNAAFAIYRKFMERLQ